MKTFHLIVLSALLLIVASCAQAAERAVGDWHGVLVTPSGELTVVVRIFDKAGAISGEMESPDQAPGQLIPLAVRQATAERLAFDVPSIGASFAGNWDASAGGWTGIWTQSVYKLPLTLRPGPGASAIKGMDGVWEGKVQRADGTRRLILRITTTGQSTSIKFDAPDAGAMNLAVANFSRQDDHVRFSVPVAGATFDGNLAPSGDRMEGMWVFPGQAPARVIFLRTKTEARQAPRLRPQEPKPPFPYRTEEVRIDNPAASGVKLACTLSEPQGAGPFPAAVLVTGSGGQDRDEAIFGHKPFAVIADHLTRQGIAVLRCDDRGIAKSTGSFGTATTDDFATDANAAVAFLKQRREIKQSAIGLIGHSEGGLIAMIAASSNAQITYLVLLASPGTPMRQLLLTQRRLLAATQGIAPEVVAKSEPIVARIFDAVVGAASDAQAAARVRAILSPDVMSAMGMPESRKELYIQEMSNTWMRHLLRIDPTVYLTKVNVPVLALNGSLDRQVEPDANLAGIKTGLRHATDVTVLKLQGLNHFFQTAKTGGMSEYIEIQETVSSTALQPMSDWLTLRLAR